MRHFRGYRGTRRRNGLPRSTIRTVKRIVVGAASSEAAGLIAVTVVQGNDTGLQGQTGVTDTTVPVGSKIAAFEIFMPKVNLAATANFITWSLQRTQAGQSVLNPVSAGGANTRNNIMLTGVVGLGEGQNNNLHVKYRIPPKFQRIQDGNVWSLVMNNTSAVSTFYYMIYKIII